MGHSLCPLGIALDPLQMKAIRYFWVITIFFALQVLETGFADMLEHRFVNARVHAVHNFPDILQVTYDADG